MAEFRLLGPVEVWAGGGPVSAGQPRQRCVLAALLVDVGRPVAWETLVDRVWGREPPKGARHALHTHVARIRRVLAAACAAEGGDLQASLLHHSGGYVLRVDPELVDLHRFRRLLDSARDPGCPDAERVALLRTALALWRGEPLTGLSGGWATRVRDGWRGQHLETVVLWAQGELRAGNPGAVIGPLTDLLGEHPLVEPLSAVLMRALHAVGRTAEALDCYVRIRRRMVEELGAEPGAELRGVHQAILRDEIDWPALQAPTPTWPSRGVPAQLPLDVPGFCGRTAQLAQLDAALASGSEQSASVVIAALVGTAGVGKTALAVHWAHTVAGRFPDGQLYVNLRGFDPGGTQIHPAAALRGFLEALGVPAARIPTDLPDRAALYRSVLAGRRALVLLDNARDAEQVRPLLPGTPGCLVLVTSRDQLTSLVAGEGARPVKLDLLPVAEARQLLSRRIGADRAAAEPDAVEEIIRRCARLPLALVLVAARAVTQTSISLRALAAELRGARGRLDVLTGGDAVTDVRAVFSWSYQALTPLAATLFRLLGTHPGPEVSAPAAASLARTPAGQLGLVLAELARAHLVSEQAPGRFGLHDLLRAYAAELAATVHGDDERRAAVHRLLDHYLHTGYAAAMLLQPHRDSINLPPAHPGVVPEALADHDQALSWFVTEHPVLLGAVRQAIEAGFDAHAWRLAWILETFLHRRGHTHDLLATQTAALEATQRLGDQPGQAGAHRGLARACAGLGQYHEAHTHFKQALAIFDEIGDATGRARTHLDFALVLEGQGYHAEALRHAERALALYERVGHRAGPAYALSAVGWYHALLGNHEQAVDCCDRALALHREMQDRYGEAAVLDSLGYAHHHLGRHREAITCFERSVALLRALGDRYYEAVVLTHLGDVHHAAGQTDTAVQVWRCALIILDDLDHPDADQVRANLQDLQPTPTPGSNTA